jgi:hypothetical protein
MPRYELAHIREQGIDLIIMPLEDRFEYMPSSDQRATIAELQQHARAAGLAGTVVPVWNSGNGQMSFIAPNNWHPFFQGINLQWVGLNINKELSW